MNTLTQASRQWAMRPDDERFTSLDQLLEHTRLQRAISHAGTAARHSIEARPIMGDQFDEQEFTGLAIVGVHDEPVFPTNWAFGQLASLGGAPASYLRTLSPDLAADCLNFSLKRGKNEAAGTLVRHNGEATLAATTGPAYGRIWNAEVAEALHRRFGNGIDGDFTVPGEFGQRVEVTRDNTTIYASDRDMFVFLADETNKIEVPGRRPGETGLMSRGFFVWNSEVGSQTLGVATFLFDYVCRNRIVWGADGYSEIRIRHTANAPMRWIDEVTPAIQAYAEKPTLSITSAIEAARAQRLDEDQVDALLVKRFTRNQAQAIRLAHRADEDRPIETAWDVVVGATAYARNIQHQDQRVAIERTAGKILTAVAS